MTGADEAGAGEAGPGEAGAGETSGADIRVVGGDPTVLEVAALTAVFAGVFEELSVQELLKSAAGPSAWQRAQRAIRQPIHTGPGQWRGFSAS